MSIFPQTAISRLIVIDATPEAVGDTQKPLTQIPGDADIYCTCLTHHAGRVDLLKDFFLTLEGKRSL